MNKLYRHCELYYFDYKDKYVAIFYDDEKEIYSCDFKKEPTDDEINKIIDRLKVKE